MNRNPKLIWTSGEVIIENSCGTVEHDLTFTEKSIVEVEGQGNKVKSERRPLFRVIKEQPRTIVTFQGFLERIKKVCDTEGIPYTVEDKRDPFPGPKLYQTKGHRFGQYELLAKGLLQGRSGLFKAPTRYGKLFLMINTLRAYPGIKTVVAAPGVDLMGQQLATIQKELPDREVKGIFSGSRNRTQSDDITIVSFDSLDKLDYDSVRLLLIDEPHAAVSPERLVSTSKFKRARVYGYGATLEGRFDGRDDLIVGLMGPVLAERTFQEAVTEGAICPIIVWVVKVPFHAFKPYNRLAAYRHLLLRNRDISQMAGYVCNEIIPADWQTLLFISEAKQADMVKGFIHNGEVAIAGRMNAGVRKEVFNRMVTGDVKRCISTNIYGQGVTFPDLRCMVNLAMGGGSITGVQKPGRLAQMRPGKRAGHVIDFVFEGIKKSQGGGTFWDEYGNLHEQQEAWNYGKLVEADGRKRIQVYEDLGYTVKYVNSLNEIKLE